ncbi:hypothetical protein M3Y99_00248000 [Aphelenchoides fujianensis]|nr:hypothetical protein M3Y99_00248000 [Aphelenchoides fujianensis]
MIGRLFSALLVCLLLVHSDGSPVQDTAQLVYDSLTNFLTKDQLASILTVVAEDIYAQKSMDDIREGKRKWQGFPHLSCLDAKNKIVKSVSAIQASSFLSMYSKLKQDLGDDFDSVTGKIMAAVGKKAQKLINKLKKKSKKLVKSGKSKQQAVDGCYPAADKLIKPTIKAGMSAASQAVSQAQWKIVSTDLAKLLRFDLYA